MVEVVVLQGYALCPYCYSHPPFREMRKGMGCNECTHPSCPNALAMTGVSGCVECDSGTLVLDLMSAPKWRIVCNRSAASLHAFHVVAFYTGQDTFFIYGVRLFLASYCLSLLFVLPMKAQAPSVY